MQKFRTLVLHATAAGLCLMGCGMGRLDLSAASPKPEKDRKPAPDFKLKDAGGRTVRLADYRGKVVLLNFWATWCGPCKFEIPWFMEFEQKYKDQGFAVLGVAMDEEGWDVVRPYVERLRINYRILMGNDEMAERYGGVDALPTTFLVDRQSRIAAEHRGLVSKDQYQDDIEHLLGGGNKGGLGGRGAPVVSARVLAK